MNELIDQLKLMQLKLEYMMITQHKVLSASGFSRYMSKVYEKMEKFDNNMCKTGIIIEKDGKKYYAIEIEN